MSRYTNESPMEWQYQNGTGPVDGRSPFSQVSANAQRPPKGMNSSPRKSEHELGNTFSGLRLIAEIEGTNDPLDSPSKSRTMGALQSSPTKALPPTPAWSQKLFNTPRKPRDEIDDSSAGETPKSPEPKDDSDATPEIKNSRSALTRFDSATAPTLPGAERERGSSTTQRLEPQRRESFMFTQIAKLKNKFNSPGRGEIPRSDHSGAIEKTARRRKKEVDRRVARRRRHSMSDSGEDNDQPPKSPRKTSGRLPDSSENKPHWATSFFSFIAQHPTLPETLTVYAQFVFNIFLLSCCGYLIYCFWSAVQDDVEKKSFEAMADISAEIARCAQDYRNNNCEPEKRTPYMANVCDNWYKCMTRDPRKVGRAKVSAHTFAEIFNSFVDTISYKAMIFTAIMVFGCFAISNFVCYLFLHRTGPKGETADSYRWYQAFGFFRHKAQQYQPNYGYGYGYGGPPPPTPQRSFSGQEGGFYAGTPWHQPPPGVGFEPQPSGGFGQIEGQGSPVRRIVYN